MYRLNALIAVKGARVGEEEHADHANEQKMFQILEIFPHIHHLIRCFYQRSTDTFLELALNASVAMRLGQYQVRDGIRVLRVTRSLSPEEIIRWIV